MTFFSSPFAASDLADQLPSGVTTDGDFASTGSAFAVERQAAKRQQAGNDFVTTHAHGCSLRAQGLMREEHNHSLIILINHLFGALREQKFLLLEIRLLGSNVDSLTCLSRHRISHEVVGAHRGGSWTTEVYSDWLGGERIIQTKIGFGFEAHWSRNEHCWKRFDSCIHCPLHWRCKSDAPGKYVFRCHRVRFCSWVKFWLAFKSGYASLRATSLVSAPPKSVCAAACSAGLRTSVRDCVSSLYDALKCFFLVTSINP